MSSSGPTSGSRSGELQRTPGQLCAWPALICDAKAFAAGGHNCVSRSCSCAVSSARIKGWLSPRSKVAPSNQCGCGSPARGDGNTGIKPPRPLTGLVGKADSKDAKSTPMGHAPQTICPRTGCRGGAWTEPLAQICTLPGPAATTTRQASAMVFPCASSACQFGAALLALQAAGSSLQAVSAGHSARLSELTACPHRHVTPGVFSKASTKRAGLTQPPAPCHSGA